MRTPSLATLKMATDIPPEITTPDHNLEIWRSKQHEDIEHVTRNCLRRSHLQRACPEHRSRVWTIVEPAG